MAFYIHILDTPNPNAVKFISQYTVKTEGKSNYRVIEDAANNPLAIKIFDFDGVEQLYFFDNYITVTKRADVPWDDIAESIHDLLQVELPQHNPNYVDANAADTGPPDRTGMAPELLEVEEILDRTVRPFLASDGGGVEVVERKDNVVYIKYQGACGTCPTSSGGTLMAIESTLRSELGEHMEVVDAGGGGAQGGFDDYWW